MNISALRWAVVLALAVPTAAPAHDTDSQAGVLGKVAFASTCDPKVQPAFERAVAMLHSFWYSAGEQAFRDVLKEDPGCAIAGWGIASLFMNNPLAGQGALLKNVEPARAALADARRIGAKSERERDYIDAVSEYYRDFENRPERDRQLGRAKAYEALAAKYPNDDEAQIFSALYTAATQAQSDQTFAAYLKAASALEPQFRKYPEHPGVAHYLIHSYDAPPIAQKGLDAARRYSAIAPAAPHALHMPSHIFTRVGAWEESAATNLRSMQVAKAGNEPNEAYHAADYMVYAYLQLGRDAEARKMMEEARQVSLAGNTVFVGPYAQNAMPARYALERGDWKAAAALQPPGTTFAHTEAITYFARSLGEVRGGDVAGARKDAEQLEALHKKLLEAKNNYWATEVEVQRLAIAAWILHSEGKKDEALKLMGAAADLEDRNEKHIVTPGRIVPARELLAELYLEMRMPQEALAQFEASQKREPNRYRNYLGSARAAEMQGDRTRAAEYYRKLVSLAKNADDGRPELVAARKFSMQ